MADPIQDSKGQGRRQRSMWLLIGGGASLLLPLLGVLYLRAKEANVAGPSGRNDLFEHREGGERKILPSQTVVPPAVLAPPPAAAGKKVTTGPAPGSSLDFIKAGSELKDKPAETPPASSPAPVTPKASKTKSSKRSKKAFARPKLQPTRGFNNFKGGSKLGQSKQGGVLDPQAEGNGQDMQELMKNMPSGADSNPDIQKMLKGQ